MKKKIKILFFCSDNSCRSQMAEGWANYLKKDIIVACSAGVEKQKIDQNAVKVMNEAGVDISNQYSKTVNNLKKKVFDFIIIVSGYANTKSLFSPDRSKIVRFCFDDPIVLSINAKNDEEVLFHYRRVRDEIKDFINSLPELLYRIIMWR